MVSRNFNFIILDCNLRQCLKPRHDRQCHPSPARASDSAVLLRKSPRKRLNAIRDPLELILLLACNLVDYIRCAVVIAIAPLDLWSVEVNLHIRAVDILGRARGEATKSRDEANELLDVVAGTD